MKKQRVYRIFSSIKWSKFVSFLEIIIYNHLLDVGQSSLKHKIFIYKHIKRCRSWENKTCAHSAWKFQHCNTLNPLFSHIMSSIGYLHSLFSHVRSSTCVWEWESGVYNGIVDCYAQWMPCGAPGAIHFIYLIYTSDGGRTLKNLNLGFISQDRV